MISFGPFAVLWVDRWTGSHGLDLEVTVGRRIYSLAFGFGRGIRAMRGWA